MVLLTSSSYLIRVASITWVAGFRRTTVFLSFKSKPRVMIKGFPQFTPNARKGERGVDVVSRVVHEQFKWLFKRNHQEHDFGIDGQLEVVTDEGAVTGQMLAVQIKYGKSFFDERNKWGYVYRGELKHFT